MQNQNVSPAHRLALTLLVEKPAMSFPRFSPTERAWSSILRTRTGPAALLIDIRGVVK